MEAVLKCGVMDISYETSYTSLCEDLQATVQRLYQPQDQDLIRIHGDAHVGNLLWRMNNCGW